MTDFPVLRSVIVREAILECYDQVERHLDKRVVFTHDSMRWPGKHKNVCRWWELEDGTAVAWNENPNRGWSFPSMKLPKAFTVPLYKDAKGHLRPSDAVYCAYEEWINARQSPTYVNHSQGTMMIYSAAKQAVFVRIITSAPEKTKLDANTAKHIADIWLRSMNL